jgi:hypothetical protein
MPTRKPFLAGFAAPKVPNSAIVDRRPPVFFDADTASSLEIVPSNFTTSLDFTSSGRTTTAPDLLARFAGGAAAALAGLLLDVVLTEAIPISKWLKWPHCAPTAAGRREGARSFGGSLGAWGPPAGAWIAVGHARLRPQSAQESTWTGIMITAIIMMRGKVEQLPQSGPKRV